jgi:hypothetical protein
MLLPLTFDSKGNGYRTYVPLSCSSYTAQAILLSIGT